MFIDARGAENTRTKKLYRCTLLRMLLDKKKNQVFVDFVSRDLDEFIASVYLRSINNIFLFKF